ncbi:MAG: amidohydrolase, partial [Bdellovibrionales bacterium]|nr:amidohydrolase [Bdellovibrionales bacterium]
MKPLTIDIHTHILPPPDRLEHFERKFGYGGFVHLEPTSDPCCANMVKSGNLFRRVKSNCWDPATRLRECDTADVDVQVLSTVPVMFSYWAKPKDGAYVAAQLNDHIAEVVQSNPKRFVGLGTLPLQDTDLALKELERCVSQLALAGIEIGSHIDTSSAKLNLNDPKLFPVFELCQELDVALFVHPWDMMGMDEMSQYWLPWTVGMPAESARAIASLIFGGVFERLPKLRIAIAHGGGSFPATIGRFEQAFFVRPDLVAQDNQKNPREYCGKFWVDSLVHDEFMLRRIVELFGENKVALGTDYPFPLGEYEPLPGGGEFEAGKLIHSIETFSSETKS